MNPLRTLCSLLVEDYTRLAAIEAATRVSIVVSKPGDRVEEPAVRSLTEVDDPAVRAMRRAYAGVVLENLRLGLPVIQWRDGRVVEVPAELLAPHARRILEVNGEPLPVEETRTLLRGVTGAALSQ